MKFDIHKYNDKCVMHCKTQEEAMDFCKYLDSIGKRWFDGDSYVSMNCYMRYKDKTCYNFNKGVFADYKYFKNNGFTILEWSDYMKFIKKKFTKADLQNGDVVLRRNGSVEIVMLDFNSLICADGGWNDLDSVDDDLKFKNCFYDDNNDNNWDIIEVRRPTMPSECRFAAYDLRQGRVVYKECKPKKMTVADIEKELGYKIKII